MKQYLPARLASGTMHTDVIQGENGGQWQSLTFFNANLASIEAGEMQQARVQSDSRWVGGRRSLVLVDLEHNVPSHLEQVRANNGERGTWQKSTYSWETMVVLNGSGVDWLIPTVSSDGSVRGYLVYSVYASNQGNPGEEQRKAVAQWRANSESH